MSHQMPEYFYLYLSLDHFGLKKLATLLQGKLPLAGVRRFNDPFDTKLSFDHSNHNPEFAPEDRRAIEEHGWRKEAVQWIQQQQLEQDWQKKYTGCCFSERRDSLLMWAHYADSHKGICLQFKYDSAKLPAGSLFKKMHYSTHYPKLDAARIVELEQTLLLTKSTDWMYEKEWRFVAPPETYKEIDGFDGLVGSSPFILQKIYLGTCCSLMEFTADTGWAERILGKDIVADVSKALTEYSKVYPDPNETPAAWEVILNALEALRVSEVEDTVKVGEQKRIVAQSILIELIKNLGMTEQLKKSDDAFRLVVAE